MFGEITRSKLLSFSPIDTAITAAAAFLMMMMIMMMMMMMMMMTEVEVSGVRSGELRRSPFPVWGLGF